MDSAAEVNVPQSGLGQNLLILSVGGNSHVGVSVVCVGFPVNIQPFHESGGVGLGNVSVLVEQAVSLGNLHGGGVQARVGDVTGHHVLVGLGVVGAVVILPGQGVNAQDVGVIVGGVGLEDDGVLLGEALDQERTIVGNGVGRGAVLVAVGLLGSSKLVHTKGAALAQEVGAVHGEEDVVAQHGQEVGSGIAQGVFQGVLIQSLHAHVGEVSGLAVHILGSAHDETVNQPFQAGLAVQHVLHTGNEVIGSNLADLTALGIDPLHALTNLEGEDGHILVGLIALGQGELLGVLQIVHHQAIAQLNQRTGVGLQVGVQSVPGLRIGAGGVLVLILQGIAVVSQISLGFGNVSSGIGSFHPHRLQGIPVGSLDDLLGGQDGVLTVGVVAPQGAVGSLGNGTANGVVAIVRGSGQQNAGLQQLGLGQSLQSVALVYVHALQGFHVHVIEFAQVFVVELLVIHFFQRGILSGRRTQHHGQDHGQSQHDCEKFLHVCIILLTDFSREAGRKPGTR